MYLCTEFLRMNPIYILLTIVIYFGVLFLIAKLTGKRSDNDAFYRGNRQSPWYVVSFGMIGASLSGVTFVSVPGMVKSIDMTYMQTCIGFFFGYLIIAHVLLPLYYKLNLTSISPNNCSYSTLSGIQPNQNYDSGYGNGKWNMQGIEYEHLQNHAHQI